MLPRHLIRYDLAYLELVDPLLAARRPLEAVTTTVINKLTVLSG